ncbi:MAG: ABC-F family ATP-binding cassette domain-containing protein [Bdellovibrionaceae bacterium]|nr:ABC-F family ATP-binding cassette domain-containing protein [Pseudobdellovibrionaceae bacterium]
MIYVSGIAKHFGSKVLYKDGSFQINRGEKIGLVGANGSGKTTIFRILAGEESVDEGEVSNSDKLVIGYFSQNLEEMSGRTALQEVESAHPRYREVQQELARLEAKLSEPMDDDEMAKTLERYGELQGEFENMGGYELEAKAAEILTGLGVGPEDYNRPVETFSGGWKMRIALAKILLINPDLLLMDEPTNHLDVESIMWLEGWLKEFKGAILMTSHDREFMNQIVSRVIEVAHQKLHLYGGNYDFYEKEREIRLQQLMASAKRQEDMLAKEKEFIARFAARASHAAQVQSRVKKIEKIDIIEIPTEEKAIRFEWPQSARGGDEVLVVENLTKTWQTPENKEKLVFRDISALVKRQDRIAVVGVNGAGKSTFMKVVTGQADPTSGTYKIGPSIEVGYFSQNSLDVLNPESTIFEEVHSHMPTASVGFVRTLLGSLLFSGDEVDKKIKILSGGEKSRVVLATILSKPVNFLVLDEPTNHLDIKSREILMEALNRFEGTIMMVSHDRYFLRALTNRVFALSKNKLIIFDGTYDEYLERAEQLHA